MSVTCQLPRHLLIKQKLQSCARGGARFAESLRAAEIISFVATSIASPLISVSMLGIRSGNEETSGALFICHWYFTRLGHSITSWTRLKFCATLPLNMVCKNWNDKNVTARWDHFLSCECFGESLEQWSGPRGERAFLSEIDRIDETKENICKNNRFLKKQNSARRSSQWVPGRMWLAR